MARLTDIKTPEHYSRPHQSQPKKRSFFKTLLKVITSPIWGPFYLVYFILAGIKNLIVKIVLFFWRGMLAVIRAISKGIALSFLAIGGAVHRFDLAATSAIKNFFTAIPIAAKGALSGIVFGIAPKVVRIFPTNWAAWLVFLLAITLIWQIAAAWDFPLLSLLDYRNGKWQAVFLSNDQVYFGHLKNTRGSTAILKDVFYLRNREGNSGTTDLVRLGNGNELHGPENTLFIPREQIIFWENLREDSQVVQLIQQFDSR